MRAHNEGHAHPGEVHAHPLVQPGDQHRLLPRQLRSGLREGHLLGAVQVGRGQDEHGFDAGDEAQRPRVQKMGQLGVTRGGVGAVAAPRAVPGAAATAVRTLMLQAVAGAVDVTPAVPVVVVAACGGTVGVVRSVPRLVVRVRVRVCVRVTLPAALPLVQLSQHLHILQVPHVGADDNHHAPHLPRPRHDKQVVAEAP